MGIRTAPPNQAVEMLLRALYEGTASDGPWVAHNGAAWEMGDMAYDEEQDEHIPYCTLLVTRASERTRALTVEAARAVRAAAEALLALLEMQGRDR
jgi:hypothetical protein